MENFRPGVLKRAGIGLEVLHRRHPDLVILRVSGYGQDGPMRKTPAFGRAAEAMSGLAHLTGFADGSPTHPGFPTSPIARRGQFEAPLRLIDYHISVLTGPAVSPMRNGLRQPMDFAPGGTFRTKDDVWVTVSAGVSVEGDAKKVVGPAPRLSDTLGSVRRLGRRPGADTAAFMEEFGPSEGLSLF